MAVPLLGCAGKRDAAVADAAPVSLAPVGECAASSQAARASCQAEVRPYASMAACLHSEAEIFDPLCHALYGGPVSTDVSFDTWCAAMAADSAQWSDSCLYGMGNVAIKDCVEGHWPLGMPHPDAQLTQAEMQALWTECERIYIKGDPKQVAEAPSPEIADLYRGYEFLCAQERYKVEREHVVSFGKPHTDAGPASP